MEKVGGQQRIAILIVLLAVLLGVGLTLATGKKPAPSPKVSAPTSRFPLGTNPTPTITLSPAYFSLAPRTSSINKGEKITLSLKLNSGSYQIDAVDAVLSFDPKVFKIEAVTPGKIFAQYPIKRADNQAGLIQLSAAGEVKEGSIAGFIGEEEYGQITLTALEATSSTAISFGAKSILASRGQNILNPEKSLGGNYTIK